MAGVDAPMCATRAGNSLIRANAWADPFLLGLGDVGPGGFNDSASVN